MKMKKIIKKQQTKIKKRINNTISIFLMKDNQVKCLNKQILIKDD